MAENTPTLKRRDEGKLFRRFQDRFRRRRFAKIEEMITFLLERSDTLRILDVGGRAEYWNMLSPKLRSQVHLTLFNSNEELLAYSERAEGDLNFENVSGNACHMPQFEDGSFDFVHSNSVVEHLGLYADMKAFASEIQRVAHAYYVQTPNFWFPIDPHTALPLLHWLPDPVRMFAHTHFTLGLAKRADIGSVTARLDGCRMINRRFMHALFPDAVHTSERFAFIFAKSLIATRIAK